MNGEIKTKIYEIMLNESVLNYSFQSYTHWFTKPSVLPMIFNYSIRVVLGKCHFMRGTILSS